MRNCFIIFCLFLLVSVNLKAQKIQNFNIPPVAGKIKNSLYNSLKIIDGRPDTSSMGIVQLGAFNRKARVVPDTSLTIQIKALFGNLIDENAGNDNMLLLIRQFSFAEITGSFSEKGYCYLRAGLYAAHNEKYQKISVIDTVICLKSSLDVTGMILKAGGEAISNFIAGNLIRTASGLDYTYNDILNIDSYEKSTLKLFNTTTYADGLYLTYQSFRDQLPDKQIVVEDKNDINVGTIKAPDSTGKLKKVKSENVYAVVNNGIPYIATKSEYCPLKKVSDNLVFIGKAKVTANTADVIAASMFFGLAGGLLANNAESVFEMKIDHINGGFIRLREIPQNTQQRE